MLYEAASGYALFEALDADAIAQNSDRMQEAIRRGGAAALASPQRTRAR